MKMSKDLLQSIEKTIMSKERKPQASNYAPTGCHLLDIHLGGGAGMGLPFGHIINIVGDESTGKTFLALEILAACYHKFGDRFDWRYDDAESGFGFDTEYLYGFDAMGDDHGIQSNTVEDWFVNLSIFVRSIPKGGLGLYILDSLDGLSDKAMQKRGDDRIKAAEKGEDFDKGSYGMSAAKFLSQEMFRPIAGEIEESNVLVIVISQTRDKIKSAFPQKTRAGGNALSFYSHTVLWLAVTSLLEKKGRAVGAYVRAKAKKSKTPRPFRESTFSFLFDYGLDDIGTSVDYLFDLLTDGGKPRDSRVVTWADSKPVTLNNLKDWLESHDLLDRCQEETHDRLKKIEVLEWIEKTVLTESEELRESYQSCFGDADEPAYSRDELIRKIEDDSDMRAELERRVTEKWEAIEEAVRTDRPGKYAGRE
jgi:RecA/RadA recombinase